MNASIQCNSFIIEEEFSIGFVPGQPDNLFAFPSGKNVLDDQLLYNNDNSIGNEADVGNDDVPDDNDNYSVIYDRTDDANPPSLPPKSNIPCIHSIIREINKNYKFWIYIPNIKSETSVAHNYSDNDGNNDNYNTYNDIIRNQIDSNNNTINLDKFNTISSIEHEVNKECLFWKTGKDHNNDFSCNNNHNQGLEKNIMMIIIVFILNLLIVIPLRY